MQTEHSLLLRLAFRTTHVPCFRKGVYGPCWRWDGTTNKGGYGAINVKHDDGTWVPRGTHRTAYKILVGPVPDDLDLDHLCRNRACWNPQHLEPVTRLVNVLRGLAPTTSGAYQRAITHCPSGHPYSQANTRVANGRRHCRACDRARARRSRDARRTQP